jgi:uncharacterized protein (UPF0371 family)
MGVNMAGNCIIDDEACAEASRQEILRRYYSALCQKRIHGETKDDLYKLELLINQANTSTEQRKVVAAALEIEERTKSPAMAIELPDGRIITGKTKALLGAASAMLLNALKAFADIDMDIYLVAAQAIAPIQKLKTEYLGSVNPRLHTDEILIALSTSASTDEKAALALSQLPKLKGCDAHSTVILSSVDSDLLRKLGIQLTCEPKYEEEERLYHKK